MVDTAQAVFHLAPRVVAPRELELPAAEPGQLLIKAECSAISPGTESLIFRGAVPEGIPRDEAIASLSGDFGYPFRYGYALVGEVVEAGSEEERNWVGRRVFAFHPHQDYALVERMDCRLLPDDMPAERALFLANLEAALNLVQDAGPRVGERAMVFGQGVVGLLVTAVLSRFPLAELISADPIPLRRRKSLEFGAALAIDPANEREYAVLRDCLFFGEDDGLDLAVEVSGKTEALNQAMDLSGFGGRVVVGSWYGRNAGPVDLGGHFHRRRISLISSQVTTLSPQLAGRWTKARQWRLATEWLALIRPERLISHRFTPGACQEAFELAANPGDEALQIIFDYR